jgi:hypothetical protein
MFSVFQIHPPITAGCVTTRRKGVCFMKFSKWSKKTVLILIPALLICFSLASCTPMCLYPLARAFGGPKESELKVIRESFSRMQRDLPSSKLAVYPSCLTSFEKHEWKPETPELMIDLFRDEHRIETHAVKTHPDVAFMPAGRNQMRFMWDRARAYAAWIRDAHPVPEGEYAMFTDFICPSDSNCRYVGGVHVYITDSMGNICYTTLINSKHEIYQKTQPDSLHDCCAMAVERFFVGLKKDAIELFPPYGVG